MKGRKFRSWIPALAPLAVLGLMLAVWPKDDLSKKATFSLKSLSERLENVTIDWRFQARADSDPPADQRILVVGIGEYSLENIGRWPWPRSHHGQLLLALTQKPPRAIAFDILFTEPSADADADRAFGEGLSLHPGSITGATTDSSIPDMIRKANVEKKKQGLPLVDPVYREEGIGKTPPLRHVEGDVSLVEGAVNGPRPVPEIAESGWTGFVDAPPSEIDGMRRQIPMVVRYGDSLYPSLVLQTLIQYEKANLEEIRIELGNSVEIPMLEGGIRRIPIDERGMFRINYRGINSFEPREYAGVFSHLQTLNEKGTWPAPEEFPPVEGQMLLIGQTAEGLTDFGPTPLKPLEPLVLVHANALNNILQEDYLNLAPRWPILAIWLVLAWTTLLILRKFSVTVGVVVPLAFVFAYGVLCFWLFRTQSLQLPLFLPVIGFIGVHGSAVIDRLVVEIRAKGRIKSLFGTYVSPDVVEAMVNSGEEPSLGGEESEITAFFSDVQSFSTFSEKLSAARLVALMIDYLSEMTDIIQFQGGTLDKYIGDAIVGMFGAPLPFPDHAHRACQTAIEIQKRQAELRIKWEKEGDWPEIVRQMQTRIGLNSGQAVIGNMGSRTRFNYTMMGDNVNLAARCESGAKAYGVYTMVTEECRRQAIESSADLSFRYLDRIIVKGRSQPVSMYELIGFEKELTTEMADCLSLYGGGIKKYLEQDWQGARKLFLESSKLEAYRPETTPGVTTNPSLVMSARSQEMEVDPPGEDWDGIFVMKTK